jgi:hypothetical protein
VKSPVALLVISHAVLAAAGFAVHRANSSSALPAIPVPADKESPSSLPSSPASAGLPKGTPANSTWTASECRKAWRALKGSQLPAGEIVFLRRGIMDAWLKADLHSALIVWSDEETIGPSIFYNLDGAIPGHKAEMREWILAGEFGMDGKVLLDRWIEVASKDPDALLAALPKIPAEYRDKVITGLFSLGLKNEELDAKIAKIAEIPDEALQAKAWVRAIEMVRDNARFNGREDRVAELLVRPDIPPEARRAAAESYAVRLADEREPPKALEAFRRLAPEDQLAVGPKLLEHAGSYSAFYASAVTNALTMLVESNQWELIEAKGPQALDDFFANQKPDAEAVSRWALQLPPRDETAAIFRHAVAGRFRDDLNAGAEWARSLDDGWQRDQALAQLAIAAEGNTRLRDESIGDIQDPDIRQEMETWRTSPKK